LKGNWEDPNQSFQILLFFCSAKPLLSLGHHALVWLVGFRIAGFMLSGSGIRLYLGIWDYGGVDGEKVSPGQ